jgi:hypothetical protein
MTVVAYSLLEWFAARKNRKGSVATKESAQKTRMFFLK